jgi:hypothetical protein
MTPSRNTWISAAVVGVVLAGGVSVIAAASAGRIESVTQQTKTVVTPGPDEPVVSDDSRASDVPDSGAGPATEAPPDYVVSKEVNPDPEKVTEYWTEHRMEDAEPMPMPVATVNSMD